MSRVKVIFLLPTRFGSSPVFPAFIRYLRRVNEETGKEGINVALLPYEKEDLEKLSNAYQKSLNSPVFLRTYFRFDKYPFEDKLISEEAMKVIQLVSNRLKASLPLSDPELIHELRAAVLSDDISMESAEAGFDFLYISAFFHNTKSVEDYFLYEEKFSPLIRMKAVHADSYRLFAYMNEFWNEKQNAEKYLSLERKIREELNPPKSISSSYFALDRMYCYLRLASYYSRKEMPLQALEYVHHIYSEDKGIGGHIYYFLAQNELSYKTNLGRHRKNAIKDMIQAIKFFYPLSLAEPEFYAAKVHFVYYKLSLIEKNPFKIKKIYKGNFSFIDTLKEKEPYIHAILSAYAYHNEGVYLVKKKRYEKAKEDFENSLTYFQKINQSDDSFERVYSDTCLRLGLVYAHLKKYDQATDVSLKAVALKEGLYQKDPDRYRVGLATSYYTVAKFEEEIKRYELAKKYFLLTISIYEPLFQGEKKEMARNILIECYRHLLYLYDLDDEKDLAQDAYTKAEKYLMA